MSCNCSCSYNNYPCCCPTPSVQTTTTIAPCLDGNPCDEMFSSDCIIYNGVAAPCFNINTGSSVTDLLEVLITKLGDCAPATTTTTTIAPGVLTINVLSAVTSGQIVSFGTTFYTLNSGNTLPCASGATKLGVLTSSLTAGSLITYITTGAVAAKLLIIKNNILIGSINIPISQTNQPYTISGLTWLTSDALTIQLIAQ